MISVIQYPIFILISYNSTHFLTLLIRRKENTNMDQQHIMIEAVRQPVQRRNN